MKQFHNIMTIAAKAIEDLEGLSAKTADMIGIPSGFTCLDKITFGFQKGDLIVVAGRPSMGKTTMALTMLVNMASNSGIPVLYYSAEHNSRITANRILSNICSVHPERFKNGQLSPDEWERLFKTAPNLWDVPIFIDDTPRMDIEYICQSIRTAVEKEDVKVVFIDYLQRIYVNEKFSDNRYLEINYITRELKTLALELDISIVLLSQLNRLCEYRANAACPELKAPQLIDLRDSGTIEDDADIICFLHRPDYYKVYQDENGMDLRGLVEITVEKFRFGYEGFGYLKFNRDYLRFENIETKC